MYRAARVPFAGFFVKPVKDGTYFGVRLSCVRECGVLVSDGSGSFEKIVFDKDLSYGEVYSCIIYGLSLKDRGYRFFCDDKDFPDPYARKIIGADKFGEETDINALLCTTASNKEPAGFNDDRPLRIPYEDSVIYIAHVRGLTMLDPSVRKNKGTFLGIVNKIRYLKELGVTSLLLMPVYEFLEKEKENSSYRDKPGKERVNYWGFTDAFPFAVKKSFAAGPDADYELKYLIKKLHENGIECLFTIYSGLSGSSEYYMDLFRFYVEEFHADGFRVVGSCPFYDEIAADPFLKDSKLIFENYDPSSLSAEMKAFKNVSVISEAYSRQGRRFLKSDEDTVAYLSYAVRENGKFYAPIRNLTDFCGFTLYDLVSYNRKHNEDNNEDNSDGSDYNYSWNCGVEGETGKRSVLALRIKQCKNAFLLTMLSQGTPMYPAGDEALNTNFGNNNPYCRDDETGWVIWSGKKANKEFKIFVKNLTAFRKRHSVLHQPGELKLFDYMSCKLPDVSFHGVEAWRIDQAPASREFAVLYAGMYSRQYTGKTEDSVYIIYNMHWEKNEFVLPVQGPGVEWRLVYSTGGETDDSFDESKALPIKGGSFTASPRSIAVLLLRS